MKDMMRSEDTGGGGIMGGKSQAKVAKGEKAKAKELRV